jgi:hypothetical protein
MVQSSSEQGPRDLHGGHGAGRKAGKEGTVGHPADMNARLPTARYRPLRRLDRPISAGIAPCVRASKGATVAPFEAAPGLSTMVDPDLHVGRTLAPRRSRRRAESVRRTLTRPQIRFNTPDILPRDRGVRQKPRHALEPQAQAQE